MHLGTQPTSTVNVVLIGADDYHHWTGGPFKPRRGEILDESSPAVEICIYGGQSVTQIAFEVHTGDLLWCFWV